MNRTVAIELRAAFGKVPSIVLAGILFLAQAATVHGEDTRQAARTIYEKTLQNFRVEKDSAKAREGFLDAIKRDQTYPQPRYNLARLAAAGENWSEAIRWLEEFRQFDETSELSRKAQVELDLLHQIEQIDKTTEGKRSRQYNDAFAQALVLSNAGLSNEALAQAEAATRIDHNRWEAYALVGWVLLEERLFDDSIRMFRQALRRAPSEKQVRLQYLLDQSVRERQYAIYALGGAKAIEAKDYATGSVQFARAWELFPERHEHALSAALCLVMLGQTRRATQILVQLQQSPDAALATKARAILGKLATRKR